MTASGFPSIDVSVAFSTANPLTTPGSWTSLTGYVRGLSIRRGRSHELRKTETGEAIIRLDNRDGRFDPTFTTGAYYPNVLPMRRVRIRCTQNAVTYDLFQGYVVDWGQSYPSLMANAGDTEVTIRAVDAFALFALFDLTAYSSEVLADNPVGYWRMRESGTTLFDEGSAGADMTTTGTVGVVAGPLVGGSTARTISATAGAATTQPLSDDLKNLTNDLSAEFWLKPGTLGQGNMVGLNARYSVLGTGLFTDKLLLNRNTKAGQEAVLSGTGFLATGSWMHVAVTIAGSVVSFYKNGVLHSTGSLVSSPGSNPPKLGASAAIVIGGNSSLGIIGYTGDICQVEVSNTALSAQRVAAHYAATFDTFEAQDSGAHVTALLNVIGWPAGERTIGTGSTTIQASVPNGPALDWLLRVGEDSENGIFQIGTDGKVVFHSRGDLFTQAAHITSNATFGDGGGSELAYTDIGLRYDDQDLFSEARVSRDGGTDQVVSDSTSATAYGPRTITRFGSLSNSDGDSLDAANYLLTRYKAPSVRVESVTFTGVQNTNDLVWAQILGRTTHADRVIVKRRPTAGNVITQNSNIEGVSHDMNLDPRTWTTTFNLIPSDTTTFWILADTTYGVLDTTSIPGY